MYWLIRTDIHKFNVSQAVACGLEGHHWMGSTAEFVHTPSSTKEPRWSCDALQLVDHGWPQNMETFMGSLRRHQHQNLLFSTRNPGSWVNTMSTSAWDDWLHRSIKVLADLAEYETWRERHINQRVDQSTMYRYQLFLIPTVEFGSCCC